MDFLYPGKFSEPLLQVLDEGRMILSFGSTGMELATRGKSDGAQSMGLVGTERPLCEGGWVEEVSC